MDSDPWNWSVDDVLHFFRTKAAEYIAVLPHGRLPPLDSFLPALKNNDIDGATLLEGIDTALLKNDLGVASAGVRNNVLRCIKKLRQESMNYTADQSSQSLQLPIPATAQPQSASTASGQAASPVENATERSRPGEVQFQDAQGKKRRKLNLTQLIAVPEEQIDPNGAFGTANAASQGYFADAAFPVDEAFYGRIKFGQETGELPPDGEIMVEPQDLYNDLVDENFQFMYQKKTVGETRYIYKQVHHFLSMGETRDLERDKKPAQALVPYRENLQSSRSATVVQFRAGGAEPVAIKESLEHLENGHTSDEYMQQTAGEWDFLVQKYKSTDDEVLPAYGDSDDDDGEDTVETTEGDLGLDAAEEEADDQVLSKDRVDEIMNAAVDDYISKWKDNLAKLEERKAWSVWKQMKGSRMWREALIQGAQSRIDHFSTRLNKIKREITYSEHRTEKSVQDSCVSLEVTVQDREEERWKIGVWNRTREPYHIIRHGTKTVHTGLVTPTTTSKAERPPQIHPDDQLSVSPGDVDHINVGADTEDEIQYEADVETDVEMQYDDNDGEDYHPPGASHEADAADTPVVTSADETELDAEDQLPNSTGLTDLDPANPASDTETMPNEAPPDGEDNSDFSTKYKASSSDELASPSTFVKIKSTPNSKAPQSSSAFIDLTGLSSDSSAKKKKKTKLSAKAVAAAFNRPATDATAEQVDSWDWHELISRTDRDRILIKLLRNIGSENRQHLWKCMESLRPNFTNHLSAACQPVKESGLAGIGVIKDDLEPIALAASICLSWLFPSRTSDEIRTMSDDEFASTLDNSQLGLFYKMLGAYLQKRNSSLFQEPQSTLSKSKTLDPKSTPSKLKSSDLIEISSDSQGPSQEPTPHNKRKRAVQMSEGAFNARAKAHRREQRFAESQTANYSQLAAMIPGDPSSSEVEINPARDDDYDPVYIYDRIAKQMKPHQIQGARFLWREITADDDDGAQGCVLAHTMGLGKTMQTIALLVAVNEAARSKDQSMRKQLPGHLRPKGVRKRMLRILILCPPTLIENWGRELDQWAPGKLGRVYSLDSSSRSRNVTQVEEWTEKGGIVLVGYEKFARMVLRKLTAKQKNAATEEDQAEMDELRDMLLQGPELAVADEAHKLKGQRTDNSLSAAQIETHSRIALTGTPMSNNVEEIYALISWAAPGYLGDPVEFKAHYAEPIAVGMSAESTAYERRKGVVKLKVLHTEIQPKVDRANIEVLKGSLKPKVEFVITIALGEVQRELYKRYVNALLSGGLSSKASEVKLFGWLSDLQLLTNHPHCFHSKLLAPAKPGKSKKNVQDEESEDGTSRNRTPMTTDSGSATPISETMGTSADQAAEAEGEAYGDQTPQQLGLDDKTIQNILNGFDGSLDPQLSAKIAIFLPLLKFSIECKDKVLLFSSSIPTLNYLEKLLTQQGFEFGRIDGSKTTKKKMQALEDFHDEFDIMLVSTRAGGVGLNIQDANRVFIFDYSFNPSWEEQAIGRAYRIGQPKPVYVYRFVAGGTFESNIYNKQMFKSSLSKRVVDKTSTRRIGTRNTREYLYEPKLVEQKDLNGEIGKDSMVLDRLLRQHGSAEDGKIDTMIRDITTLETLQEEEEDEPLNAEEQREVDEEVQQGRMRPKGKRPFGAVPQPPPSTAPVPQQRPGLISFPLPAQPIRHAHPGSPVFVPPPPPSTYGGQSGHAPAQFAHLGGLPSLRMPGAYQR